MDSGILKTEALCWLRFGKKMDLVCTEGGDWHADVLGIGDEFSVEVEVKVSKTDLQHEFTGKRAKHFLYSTADAPGGPSRQVPNYFYFYVPPELEEAAVEIVAKEAPKAGVAVYQPDGWALDGKKTKIARRPTKLHEKKPSEAFKKTVLRRMGSELCGRYLVQQRFLDLVTEQLHGIDKALVDAVRKMAETPDHEAEGTGGAQ